MKYIIFTFEGNGFPIAKRLIEEKQEVLVGHVYNFQKTLTSVEKKAKIKEPKEEIAYRLKHYNNIIPKMSADLLLKKMSKIKDKDNYFVFFDSNNLFYYADKAYEMGFRKGNFVTEENRLFETDRMRAKKFVKKHYPQLKLSDSIAFKSIEKAKKFIQKSKAIWVLKTQTDNIPTFVPQTADWQEAHVQLFGMMDKFRETYEESGFLLEKRIDTIIEVTPEKFYYDGVPLCTTINLENKFIGSGNIGEQVGCAGDLVFPISMQSRIHDICFPPIVDQLAKKQKGFFIWDASLLIDPKTNDMYFGEFCPNRPGYNSFFTEIAQAKSVHIFFEDIVAKKNPLPVGTYGASLMTFNMVRDYKDALLADAPITIMDNANANIWPYDIYKKTKNGSFLSVGYDKHLAPITGSGKTIAHAIDNLYKNVSGFLLAGLYYRPKFDYISKDYTSSILNRLDYCLKQKLFTLS